MALPRENVEAPPVTPLPFGLFSVATVTPDDAGEWAGGGVQYEPADCGEVHETVAACMEGPDFGTISVSVNDSSTATLAVADQPSGTYTLDWGDGSDPVLDATPNGATHAYSEDGAYRVLVTGPDGYSASAYVTVNDGETTDAADLAFGKVENYGVPLIGADPFVLYHLFRCRMVGGLDHAARAREALRLGEQRGAERHLALQLALTEGAVDLTPTAGTAVDPVSGLALLEGYAAKVYGGVPTIHLPRSVGTLLSKRLDRVGTHLETRQGSLVASGGGYEGTLVGPATDPEDAATVVAAGDGEAWVYVTGQVVVRRAPTIEVNPVPSLSPASNDFVALAERPYAITTECVTAAVLVSSVGADVIDGGGA